jgi:Flp pilus assembly protein CpaB
MFQNKKLIQLVISAAMALAFVHVYLKQKEQSIENAFGLVEVLTAARDIPPYTALSQSYLTIQKVPLRFVQPGAYLVKIPEQAMERVRGKVSVSSIPEGSQITQSNLTNPSAEGTGVAPLLPPGKRGYLLRLGSTDVADLIVPGNHIDVLATFTVRKGDLSTKQTHTILQNILVVGVGKDIKQTNQTVTGKKEGNEGLVLTLALEPEEAEQLALAQAESQGEIAVIVRPHGENDIKPIPGVTPQQIRR